MENLSRGSKFKAVRETYELLFSKTSGLYVNETSLSLSERLATWYIVVST
jgi:hypothetical protein